MIDAETQYDSSILIRPVKGTARDCPGLPVSSFFCSIFNFAWLIGPLPPLPAELPTEADEAGPLLPPVFRFLAGRGAESV